jgi:acyl phosphate:glycerol-3-phosphate acyltransferase
MSQFFGYLLAALFGYLVGAIPFGYLVVKLLTGQDIRGVGSGRTGGTNAIRAAGAIAGVLTAVGDVGKGAVAVWGAGWLGQQLGVSAPVVAQVAAGVLAVIGHNYSIYLSWKGGAGTGPNVGVAAGLWLPALFILLPLLPILLVTTGYASVTSLAIAGLVPILFAVRALVGKAPWEYVIYGVLTGILVVWALRPNIRRLKAGTERLVGPRAKAAARKKMAARKKQKLHQDESQA